MVVEKLSQSRVKVVFDVTAAEFDAALDQAFEIVNKDVKIDGFRKGKATKAMFLKKFGVEALYDEALNVVLNNKAKELYQNEITKNMVSQFVPSIESSQEEFGQGKDFKVGLSFDVMPEFELPQYKGLEIAKVSLEATEEEILVAVKNVAKAQAKVEVKAEQVINSGDIAVFDFVGTVDGVEFQGGSASNYELQIGSGQFIPGFEDQMIGMKKDEVKDVNVTFPENYQAADLAGKAAVFKVTVHEVKEEILPEITDEFVKELKLEGINTVEELKASKKKEIEDRKSSQEKDRQTNEAFNQIMNNTKVEIPQSMIDERFEQIKNQYVEQAKMYNIPFETFLSFMGTTVEQFEENMRKEAEKNSLFNLVMSKIIEVEKLEPTKEEVEERAKKDVESSKMTVEQLMQANLSRYYSEISFDKVVDLILSSAILK